MNATDSLPATGSMLMTVTGALALIILLMVVMAGLPAVADWRVGLTTPGNMTGGDPVAGAA